MLQHLLYLLHSNLAFGLDQSSFLGATTPCLSVCPAVCAGHSFKYHRGQRSAEGADLSSFSKHAHMVAFNDVDTYKVNLLFFIQRNSFGYKAGRIF